ncbi:MAG: 30S ribosomal protein S6 [Balneolales bacterium]
MKKNFYELTYVINPVLEEEEIKGLVGKFTDYLTENGAVIEEVDEWGMQRFAYDIDGKGSGYYVNAYFTAPGDLITKLERVFQIDDHIMRYLTIKYDNKMLKNLELKKKGKAPSIFDIPEETEGDEEKVDPDAEA